MAVALFALSVAAASCGAELSGSPPPTPGGSSDAASTVAAPSAPGVAASSAPGVAAASSTPGVADNATLVWSGTVDVTAIPLGDGKVSTTPRSGYVDSCSTTFRQGGAQHSGDWIDGSNNTWNMTEKVVVEGAVSWPAAHYDVTMSGGIRTLTTNDLPDRFTTGIFPIQVTDPAFRYDPNPNHIAAQEVTFRVPVDPAPADVPTCTGLGPIGVLDDGVLLYNALDDAGRDAVAHETQDSCNGHPDGRERYHHHDVPSCIVNTSTDPSTLIGFALDGFGIYVERDANGNLPSNADLDECHGRTSEVMWDGALRTMYHYDATLEYPYTVGCFRGTPTGR